MYLPKILENAAENDEELEELRHNAIAALEEDDPHALQVRRMSTQIANLRASMSTKRANAIAAVAAGATMTLAAKQAGCFPATVTNALKSKDGIQLYRLYAQMKHVRTAPSLESRSALLWRIAIREEIDNPRTSIAAVDTLNKQSGVYLPTEFTPQQPTVVVQTFQVSKDTTSFVPVGARKPLEIEGEWSPVTIEVKE